MNRQETAFSAGEFELLMQCINSDKNMRRNIFRSPESTLSEIGIITNQTKTKSIREIEKKVWQECPSAFDERLVLCSAVGL